MEILPSIDLRDAKVVRLARGDYEDQTIYSEDASAVAEQFAAAGVRWVHMVDLDAARTGRSTNAASIKAVRQAVDLNIQLGGGARDDRAIDSILAMGVNRVVVGSAAVENWTWFERLLSRPGLAGKLALGLDARGGRLAVRGWTKQTDVTAADLAARTAGTGLGAIVYTDIARDGMLAGVDIEMTEELVSLTDVPIIASGGVSSLEDIRRCRQIGCGGVIIGKAYYEGKIDLPRALLEAGEARPDV